MVRICLVFRMVYVSSTSSSHMSLVLAWTQSNLWDDFMVLTWCSFHPRGADVACSSTTCAECAVAMITGISFADDFAIHISELEDRLAFVTELT